MADGKGSQQHPVTAAGTVPEFHRIPCTSALQQKKPTTNDTIDAILIPPDIVVKWFHGQVSRAKLAELTAGRLDLGQLRLGGRKLLLERLQFGGIVHLLLRPGHLLTERLDALLQNVRFLFDLFIHELFLSPLHHPCQRSGLVQNLAVELGGADPL
jgi:hypothetical protein